MSQRVHRIGGAAVLLISLGVFLKTAAPTVSFWDCGEFIACSYTLGVPHPPGSPLYLLLGRLFTFLPIGEDPAFPVNLMSVISSALAVMFVYLITVRLVLLAREETGEGDGEDGSLKRDLSAAAGGGTAALMLAFSDTFWFNAVEAEVYGFSTMLMAMAVWLGLRWMDRAGRPDSLRLLFFAAYLMGLAGGLHLLCLLAVPTLLLLIWFTDRDLLVDPKLWGIVPLLFMLGYSTYVALYVRSGLNPAIDENNPENWTNFMLFLKREQYGSESMVLGVFDRRAPFWDYQVWSMYIKYFLAQFPVPGLRFVSEAFRKATEPEAMRIQVSAVPYVLGFWGMWLHLRRDPRRFWALAVLFLLTGVGLAVYLNMPDPQPRERDYVFVGSFAVFAIWIGMAVEGAVRRLATGGRRGLWALASALFLMMPVGLAATHFRSHDRTGNYIAYDYGANIIQSCEPGAILFTNGDNDTFPLWFLQEVMGIRKDVRVVNLSLLNTGWYIKQLRDMEPRLPIRYTDSYIDDVLTGAGEVAVRQAGRFWPRDRQVTAAGMTWVIPAPARRFLRVQDVMVLKIVDWNAWGRPVYFAMTVPDENLVGLREHLEMQGMAFRLVKERAREVDLERTRRQLFEVYRYRGVNDPNVYRDDNTRNLLVNYQAAFLQLAEAYRAAGQAEASYDVMKRCETVAVSPGDWKGYVLLAGEMHRIGRKDEALRLLERAQTVALTGDAETTKRGTVAELLLEFGHYDAAIARYTEMIDLGVAVELSLFNRAIARERLGRLEEALADLKALAEMAPGDAEVARAIGVIERRLEMEDGREGPGGQE